MGERAGNDELTQLTEDMLAQKAFCQSTRIDHVVHDHCMLPKIKSAHCNIHTRKLKDCENCITLVAAVSKHIYTIFWNQSVALKKKIFFFLVLKK